MLNDFWNSVNGMFKDYTKSFSKSLIWVQYYNLKIGNKTKMENSCMNDFLH
jgi:hypothetical protein